MSKQVNIHELLDSTLPEHLRNSVNYGSKVVATDISQTLENSNMENQTASTTAPTPVPTPKILTEAEIHAIVTKSVAEVNSAKDRDQAIAAIVREAEGHKTELSKVAAAHASLMATAEAERVAHSSKFKELEAKALDFENKHKAALASLETATKNAEALQKKLDEQAIAQVVAHRKTVLAEAGITNAVFMERATKVAADKIAMSQEDFDITVATLKEAKLAAPAPTTAPVPVPAATPPPAAGIPARPELAGAGAFTQSVASLAGVQNTPQPNADRAKYAQIGASSVNQGY